MPTRTLTINIQLESSTGDTQQLEHKITEIVNSFRRTTELELYDTDNHIVYNNWDDPHTCDLDITLNEEY